MTAAARYEALTAKRTHYITRARQNAKVTIPHLFPETDSYDTDLYTPYQSVGSRGVNNLAAKLTQALFPPGSSPFKLTVDEYTLQQLGQDETVRGEVETSLSSIEQACVTDRETTQFRPSASSAMLQLVVAGNVGFYYPKDPVKTRVFRLNQYVVRRSPSGELLEAVIKEGVAKVSLPENVLATLASDGNNPLPSARGTSSDNVDLFTHILLEKGQYTVYQEVSGIEVDGSRGRYNPDKLPYLFLRLNKVDGEDYGRSYVDDYYGDLATLESLSEALVGGSIVMSKIIFFVNPSSTTRAEDLVNTANGGFVEGSAQDVSTLQVEKVQDLSWIRQHTNEIEKRLAYAFLLNTSIQRPGERVTAEEIRMMARELESSLGGVYSVLSQEMQLPLARLQLARLQASGDIPKLPKQVKPMIVTGIEAIGRGQDLTKLEQFLSGARAALGETVVAQYVNPSEFIKRLGASLGISTKGLVLSPEEVAASSQQQAVQGMMPTMVDAGAKLAAKQMEQQNG